MLSFHITRNSQQSQVVNFMTTYNGSMIVGKPIGESAASWPLAPSRFYELASLTPLPHPAPYWSPFFQPSLPRPDLPVFPSKVSASTQVEEDGQPPVTASSKQKDQMESGSQTDRPGPPFGTAELSLQELESRTTHLNSRFSELSASLSVCPPGPDLQLFGADPPPIIRAERLERRNQHMDILHILKVRRYWHNPSAPSPNIFKRRLRKISKSRVNYVVEVQDLSRQKTYDKKLKPAKSHPLENSTNQMDSHSACESGSPASGYS